MRRRTEKEIHTEKNYRIIEWFGLEVILKII